MKNFLFLCLSACLLTACQSTPQAIGGQQDEHGCLSSTGSTWSYLKKQCVQAFDVADIRLSEEINGTTYGIYVILSEDRQLAEVFSVNLPRPTILTAVKGGFISDDKKIRLLNTEQGWQLKQN